jgi:hypothetical protein
MPALPVAQLKLLSLAVYLIYLMIIFYGIFSKYIFICKAKLFFPVKSERVALVEDLATIHIAAYAYIHRGIYTYMHLYTPACYVWLGYATTEDIAFYAQT